MSLNRRDFIKCVGAGVTGMALERALWAADATGVAKTSGKRLNVLYMFTDQQFADAMSCAGNKWVKTPAMDNLAATGARFNLTYTAHPVCSPARASMLTGLMPHQNGVTGNSLTIRKELQPQEMGWVFRNAGYRCAYGGKGHLPDFSRLEETHGFEVLCPLNDREVTNKCVEFLSQKQEKPFLLVASYHQPHAICEVGKHRDLVVSREEYRSLGCSSIAEFARLCPPMPANFDPPTPVPDMAGRLSTGKWSEAQWRLYLYKYYRMVEEVDAGIGKVLKALRDSGQEDNTLVIFSSDHGDGLGAHHTSGKNCFYEEMARVPFIVSLKGRTTPGLVDQDHMVCNGLDLMPTLCDYTGVALPAGLRGRSVRSLAEGKAVQNWRDHLVIEAGGGGVKDCNFDRARMVRTRQYKYSVYRTKGSPPLEELFDMQANPGETNNLAAKTEFKNVLKEHQDRLAAWCKETDDDFLKSTR